MSIRIILGLTIREAARRRVLWGLLILTIAFLALYALGLNFVHEQVMRSARVGRLPSFFSLKDVWNFWMTDSSACSVKHGAMCHAGSTSRRSAGESGFCFRTTCCFLI